MAFLSIGPEKAKVRMKREYWSHQTGNRLFPHDNWRYANQRIRTGAVEGIVASRNGPLRIAKAYGDVLNPGELYPGSTKGWYQHLPYYLVPWYGGVWLNDMMDAIPRQSYRAGHVHRLFESVRGRMAPYFSDDLVSADLGSLGSDLLAQAWPTNPTADAATFLGELREGLPSLVGANIKRSRSKVRGVAGEWLNLQFAIKPLVSDIKKFREAYHNAAEHVHALRQKSGQRVRRRRRKPPVVEYTTGSRDVLEGPPGAWNAQYHNIHSRHDITMRCRVWMEADFYYHIPDRQLSPALNDLLDRAEFVYGAVPGPSTVWELSPFSWAADYFANLGSLIKNLEALSKGNQFANAFVMRHTEVTHDLRYTTSYSHYQLRLETKEREKVNPFGLGHRNPSAFQWLNLLAVGAVLSDRPGNYRR